MSPPIIIARSVVLGKRAVEHYFQWEGDRQSIILREDKAELGTMGMRGYTIVILGDIYVPVMLLNRWRPNIVLRLPEV